MTGWRWTKVAMQPTASRTFAVTPARAERSVTDSRRGLARRLSPTQTASKVPERSASTVRSTRSRAWIAPRTTARFARISPNEWATRLSPRVLQRPLLEERRHALGVVVRGAQPRVRLALELERRLERRLRAAVEHQLQRPERERRLLGELRRQRVHRGIQRAVGHGLSDQSPRLGLRRGDPPARHHEELPPGHSP